MAKRNYLGSNGHTYKVCGEHQPAPTDGLDMDAINDCGDCVDMGLSPSTTMLLADTAQEIDKDLLAGSSD
jgi:hypothetical protein